MTENELMSLGVYMIENPFCVDKELEEMNKKGDLHEFEIECDTHD